METDATPEQTLAEAERVTAALWTDYPPLPWWYCLAGGAWAGSYVVALGASWPTAVRIGLMLGLCVLSGAFVGWYSTKRGVLPKLRNAPAEFKTALRGYAVGLVLLVAGCGALYFTVGYLAAAGLAFGGAALGLYAYGRAYESAVRRTQERLG